MNSQQQNPQGAGKLWAVIPYLIVAALGLAGGWYAARQTASPGGHGHGSSDSAGSHDDHAHDDEHAHGGGAHDHGSGGHSHGADAPAEPGKLSPATLRNLGVRLGKIQPRDFTVHRTVRGRIAATPFTDQPVQAPIGGRIASIEVEPGQVVDGDTTLVTILRDPLPPPTLTITESLLKPGTERIHEAVADLRTAHNEVEIVRAELKRVQDLSGELVPRNRVVELNYSLSRAESTLDRTRHELGKHGFTDAQVNAMADGARIPQLGSDSWRRALANNGLWPDSARKLYDVLPAETRDRLWSVAGIGELAARNLDTAELTAWLEQDPSSGQRFAEIAALMERGHSVADLRQLSELGALEPVVRITAPRREGTPDWDVHAIETRVGDHVAAGTRLLSLHDPRRLYLVTEPVGGEQIDLLRVAREGLACRARPLVDGAGPDLDELVIEFLSGDTGGQGTTATVAVTNSELVSRKTRGDRMARSWVLRPGLRYTLEIPTRTIENVFVLPIEAIADRGMDKVVFIAEDDDHFHPEPVDIAYVDHQVAVVNVTPGSELTAGDTVVLYGALELGLALTAGAEGGGADAHHGHSH